jgi:hypothetical protein
LRPEIRRQLLTAQGLRHRQTNYYRLPRHYQGLPPLSPSGPATHIVD